jgi:hypothetical protein
MVSILKLQALRVVDSLECCEKWRAHGRPFENTPWLNTATVQLGPRNGFPLNRL